MLSVDKSPLFCDERHNTHFPRRERLLEQVRFARLCGRIVSWKSCNDARNRWSSAMVVATSVATTCCNVVRSSAAARVRACAAAMAPVWRFHSGKGTATLPPKVCLMSSPALFALEDKGHLHVRDALCPCQRHFSDVRHRWPQCDCADPDAAGGLAGAGSRGQAAVEERRGCH